MPLLKGVVQRGQKFRACLRIQGSVKKGPSRASVATAQEDVLLLQQGLNFVVLDCFSESVLTEGGSAN